MVLPRPVGSRSLLTLRHPILFFLSIVSAPALWILFVDSSTLHEMFVGGVVSLVTVAFTMFVCRCSGTEMTLRPQDVFQIWRLPWYIVSDAYRVTLVAFKDLLHPGSAKSLYRVCGFESSKHDPLLQARTVMAVVYTTASPNIIVIGVDSVQSRMLFHQIEAGPVPDMTKALGAKV